MTQLPVRRITCIVLIFEIVIVLCHLCQEMAVILIVKRGITVIKCRLIIWQQVLDKSSLLYHLRKIFLSDSSIILWLRVIIHYKSALFFLFNLDVQALRQVFLMLLHFLDRVSNRPGQGQNEYDVEEEVYHEYDLYNYEI